MEWYKDSMNTKNTLWRPQNMEDKRKSKPLPKTADDPLCATCPNKSIHYKDAGKEKTMPCRGLCPPMQWINGNTPTKEVLLTDLNTGGMEYKDYKSELSDLLDDRRSRVNNTIDLPDLKRRAISILLLAGITKKEIANLFSMSDRQIRRLSQYIK